MGRGNVGLDVASLITLAKFKLTKAGKGGTERKDKEDSGGTKRLGKERSFLEKVNNY